MKKLLTASLMIFGMVAFASAQTGKKAGVKKGTPLKTSITAAAPKARTASEQKTIDEKKVTKAKEAKVSSAKQEIYTPVAAKKTN